MSYSLNSIKGLYRGTTNRGYSGGSILIQTIKQASGLELGVEVRCAGFRV